MAKTLAEKVWDAHVVRKGDGEGANAQPDLLFIDLHLVHEVTSPQAFEGLRLAGRKLRRPDLTIATEDHNTPTLAIDKPIADLTSRTFSTSTSTWCTKSPRRRPSKDSAWRAAGCAARTSPLPPRTTTPLRWTSISLSRISPAGPRSRPSGTTARNSASGCTASATPSRALSTWSARSWD